MKFVPALILCTALGGVALPGIASAQTAPAAAAAAAPAAAPAAAAAIGLPIPAMIAFMTAQGLTVSPLQTEGEQRFVSVVDGPLRWVVFFQSCEGEVCSDLQFSVGFSNATITLERINDWNRERRFVKAFYEAAAATEGATPSAAGQYDAFLNGVQGAEQLSDHLAIWRSLALEFARFTAPPQAAPAPAS